MDSMSNSQPSNRNRNMIIIGVVVVLVLCCCCVAASVGLWACGDMITGISNSCGF
jgi:hypothetical protein